jgi:hypothetical protein
VMLVQRFEGMRAEPGTMLFEEMVGVRSEEKLGQRKKGEASGIKVERKEEPEIEDAKETEEVEDPQEETTDIKTNEFLENGKRLMRSFNIVNFRKEIDSRSEWEFVDIRDKVFLSYLLFKYFEEEYSFVLTTSKIKIKNAYLEGSKLDYRQIMNDTAMSSQSVLDIIKRYIQETREYKKAVSEETKAISYVEQAKRISLIEGRRGAAGRQVRVLIKDFMQKVSEILKILVEDMSSASRVVDNKDEIIRFDIATEQKRRMNGKPISECITEAYSYSLALADRIENGDLYGGVIEMTDGDFRNGFQSSERDNFQ